MVGIIERATDGGHIAGEYDESQKNNFQLFADIFTDPLHPYSMQRESNIFALPTQY